MFHFSTWYPLVFFIQHPHINIGRVKLNGSVLRKGKYAKVNHTKINSHSELLKYRFWKYSLKMNTAPHAFGDFLWVISGVIDCVLHTFPERLPILGCFFFLPGLFLFPLPPFLLSLSPQTFDTNLKHLSSQLWSIRESQGWDKVWVQKFWVAQKLSLKIYLPPLYIALTRI